MNQHLTDNTITMLPPVLCGPVEYYLTVRKSAATAIDWGRHFDKRFKATHRFTIADTRGRLDLTVPIAKPESSQCTWGDIRLSDHGHWWDIHRIALESAYGRTPFFEYYADALLPMLTEGVTERFPYLRDLSSTWDRWIRTHLLLPLPVTPSGGNDIVHTDVADSSISPALPPYWQVRADKLGFIPGLSILDLIFNLGPEAVIYLDRLSRKH
ncbi:MAG: WbqC family protein [Bacteroides sp.]|nr:WbqC family protein [Bacteroides sp.]